MRGSINNYVFIHIGICVYVFAHTNRLNAKLDEYINIYAYTCECVYIGTD